MTVKNIRIAFLICTLSIFIITCKKNNINETGEKQAEEQVDLSAKVTASVSGFVTNESDAAINGANVQYGASTTTTNKYGYFEIKNANVTEKAAFVTVSFTGYFKGIKTFIAEAGKENFCRIKLIPKTITGTINAANGGDVTLTNGLNISFPANGVMDAATKTSYNGTVHVSSFWIDPTGVDLDKLMPGDLRGINENNSLKGLTTFGMAAVELTGSTGELLQIAEGKTASVTMPIPAAILANAPSTIPLWYFDETIGLWKEEGSATKNGNVYTGDVKHFSYWNCDIPTSSLVQFTCIITDDNNNPVSQQYIEITSANVYGSCAHGYTNDDGNLSGTLPANAQLSLQMKDDYGCVALSHNFSTSSSWLNLGTLKLPSGSTITVSGTVADCNNNPLTNGLVFVYKCNNIFLYNLHGSTYNFPVTNSCSSSIQIAVDAINTITNEESISSSYTINHENITLPNIVACGQTITEYANFTINDESYMLGHYNNGTFSSGCGFSGDRTQFSPTLLKLKNGVYIMNDDHIQWGLYHGYNTPPVDTNYICYFNLYRGLDNGNSTVLNLLTEGVTHNPFTWSTAPVTITEYGAPGGYVSGSYSGILYKEISSGSVDFTHPYHVNFNFRSKRFQ